MRAPAIYSRALLLGMLGLAAAPAWAAPKFKHVVIIFQENRTPDNLFGSNPTFEPGVDIATSGVSSQGVTVPLTAVPLSDCYDISHKHSAFEAALKQGFDQEPASAPKGCKLPSDPQFKFVDNSTGTVQPYFDIATHYGFANRMFQTNQGPSFPAHQFIFGGTSQPEVDSPLFASENMSVHGEAAGCAAPDNQLVAVIDGFGSETSQPQVKPCFEHRTLTDLLDAASPRIGWRYYAPSPGSIWLAPNAIEHICQPGRSRSKTACLGPDWTNGHIVAKHPARVLTDIHACDLQAVSWVIPTAKSSDHAGVNDGSGPQWVASIVDAIGTQPACDKGEVYWNDTAILITWDDWGGWFDHVRPFRNLVQHRQGQPEWGDGYLYGFRVPMLVVSAHTPAGYVSNQNEDFGTILYFIERNFGLGFIGGDDQTTYGQYADYHASSRGDMSDYFSLPTAREFVSIPARMKAKDFSQQTPSLLGPDED